MTPLRFDDALPAFVAWIDGVLGTSVCDAGVFLRDATGFLSFILPPGAPAGSDGVKLQVDDSLNAVTHSDFLVVRPDAPGVNSLLASVPIVSENIGEADSPRRIRLLDRRIVGEDWLSRPAPTPASGPPRLVFASMKGGVGRSTALAVLAADLAARGRKVLAIDLDLEAPGLGAMLLDENRKPAFGSLDWYVERAQGELDPEFFSHLVAPSALAGGAGLIDVVPATGRRSDECPANVLAKLARAYIDGLDSDGNSVTFLDRTAQLIERLTERTNYDAVLVDSRAGLNEATAAAILGLGADVLLFGVDTPQTFSALRYLFAHLSRFERHLQDDWLLRFKLVHAKASADPDSQARFRERGFDNFSEFLYPAAAGNEVAEFTQDDDAAPHFAWPILSSGEFQEFDPLAKPGQLSRAVYLRTFEEFLRPARERLGIV